MAFTSDSKRWYEITQTFDRGKWERAYRIRCRKCDAVGAYHANKMSDQHLKKHFQVLGWDIGRWQNWHVCPLCRAEPARSLSPPPEPDLEAELPPLPPLPPPAVAHLPRIEQAWELSYEDERQAFIARIREVYGDKYAAAPAQAPTPTFETLWRDARPEERAEFWSMRHLELLDGLQEDDPGERLAREALFDEVRSPSPQAPPQAVEPPPQAPPQAPPAEPEWVDNNPDEGAADWWKDLSAGNSKRRRKKA